MMGSRTVVVWGVGYIGFTNVIYYMKAGCKVVCFDIDAEKWEKICKGKCLAELKSWIPFEYEPMLKDKNVQFATDLEMINEDEELVHLICVPTEKDNEPWDDALYDVLEKIMLISKRSTSQQLSVVVESTLSPGTAKELLGYLESNMERKKIFFAVSPRRDWFVADGGNLNNLPRVFGCNSIEASEYIKVVLGLVCDNLIQADDYIQAEMTKSVENAIRHVGITIANQLADAFPDVDVIKVLELASTKWNVEHYYPSLGIGGYCIPLSSKYLINADKGNKLGVLENAVNYNQTREDNIFELFVSENVKKIGILGVCYVGNIKVTKNSVVLKLIRNFQEKGLNVYVNDPMFDHSELVELTSCDTFELEDINDFDCLILFSGHNVYKNLTIESILKMLGGQKIVWDNAGIWDKYYDRLTKNGVSIKRIGMKGWKTL